MEYLGLSPTIKELEEQLDKCLVIDIKNQMLMLQILVNKSTKKVNYLKPRKTIYKT
jgi:hypothetical protein